MVAVGQLLITAIFYVVDNVWFYTNQPRTAFLDVLGCM